MKRNGYIDIIKFLFAIIIAEFHLGSGIFLGGRIAVEGFFMITGYLMLKSSEKENATDIGLGKSTASFLWKKYKALLTFLLPATILSYIVTIACREAPFWDAIKRAPLLLFEIVPLNSTGLKGEYVVGVSWYLSSMFIALAVLYPLSEKFKQGFTYIICPLIVFLGYGTLSHFFGHLAVNYQYIGETIINSGIIRGLAGCALGCILYEVSKSISKKKPTVFARIVFTIAECAGFLYFLQIMHTKPKTLYDYLLVFVIFGFLLIGINGLSYTAYLWNPKWTKMFGTASTLIVLTHFCWLGYLKKEIGPSYNKMPQALWYALAVALSCIAVYLFSVLFKLIKSKLPKIEFWKKDKEEGK
ncbi:MAG: acyltransferase [Clostridia bacterium]|nr:acyltransferase [Clostridia bacterium]